MQLAKEAISWSQSLLVLSSQFYLLYNDLSIHAETSEISSFNKQPANAISFFAFIGWSVEAKSRPSWCLCWLLAHYYCTCACRPIFYICRVCSFLIRSLCRFRHALTDDMSKTVSWTLVGSRPDYMNALSCGSPLLMERKLQLVQNSALGCYMFSFMNIHE